MKASLALTIAFSFTLLVANAAAQSTDKPEVYVGNRWSMQYTNELVNERDQDEGNNQQRPGLRQTVGYHLSRTQKQSLHQ